MNAHTRSFEMLPATRRADRLLVGLIGPSGGGKTYSALRIATGIQRVTGGNICVIDTENGRALHYADEFKFQHVPFSPPFGSLDYLEAMQFVVAKGCKVIIVDSMSHEHEGEGGMLDMHNTELDRIAGKTDWAKREACNFLAWQKPKANRRKLINNLLQMDANFIFCFRAKNAMKLVPVEKDGKKKMQPVQQGYMPIAGEEFVFEQTACCLLPPGAKGVPQWQPEYPGERAMMKRPRQFEDVFPDGQPLSEDIGERMARWAAGTTVKATKRDDLDAVREAGRSAAADGMEALKAWWKSIGAAKQKAIGAAFLNDTLKPIAEGADNAAFETERQEEDEI